MRKLLFMVVLFIMVLVSAASVSALSANLVDNKITLGSSNQEASNYNRNQEGVYVTSQIIEFDTTLNLTLSVTPESSYVQSSSTIINNIDVTIDSQTASPNTSITIKARIPENLAAVNTIGEETAFKVATLTLSDGSDTEVIDLYMQRKSQLDFKKVTFNYGTDDQTKISNGKKISDIKPGNSGTFEIEVENTYSTSSDIDLDDVTIYVIDDNNDLDIDEEEDLGTIRDGDEDSGTISIDIENDLDEGNYDLILRTIGFDDYGARHGQVYNIIFSVEKENYELTINRLAISPESIDVCEQNYATIRVVVENTGKKDINGGKITISSTKFGTDSISDIEIDEGDATTKNFYITIPETENAGSYRFRVNTYYKDDEQSDEDEITLFVRNCNQNLQQPEPVSDSDSDRGSEVDVEMLVNAPSYSGLSYASPNTQKTDKEAEPKQKKEEGILSTTSIVMLVILIILLFIIIPLMLQSKKR